MLIYKRPVCIKEMAESCEELIVAANQSVEEAFRLKFYKKVGIIKYRVKCKFTNGKVLNTPVKILCCYVIA